MIDRESFRRWFWACAAAVALIVGAEIVASFAMVRVQMPAFQTDALRALGAHVPARTLAVLSDPRLQEMMPAFSVPPRWLGAARLVAYVVAGVVALRLLARKRSAMLVLGGAWIVELFAAAAVYHSPAFAGPLQPLLGIGAVALAAALLPRPRLPEPAEPATLFGESAADLAVFNVAGVNGVGPVAAPLALVDVPDARRGAYGRRFGS